MKVKTTKERQKIKENKTKPKPHRQESILEEMLAQKSVNVAWNHVADKIKNSPCKGGLNKIHEVEEEHSHWDMDSESSFEASSSPSPQKSLSRSPVKENMGP